MAGFFLGPALDTHAWWLVVIAALTLVLEYVAFYRGVEYGIRTFTNMSHKEQIQLIQLLDEPNNNDNNNDIS